MAESTPPRPPAPSGQPDRRALLEAYQNLVRSEHDKRLSHAEPQPAVSSGNGFWITMVLVIAALASLLVVQPGWLVTPRVQEPPAVSEASLRVRMYVEIERINQFRSDSGHLPATLAEAQVPGDGLTYQVQDGRYTLTGVNGSLALAYTSDTPPDSFLGDSYRLIRDRGRP